MFGEILTNLTFPTVIKYSVLQGINYDNLINLYDRIIYIDISYSIFWSCCTISKEIGLEQCTHIPRFSWINALINISELLVLLYIWYKYMCICLIFLRLCYIYVVRLYMLVFECSELRNDFINPLLIYDDELLTRLIVILFMMIYLLYVHLWNYEIYVVIIFQDRH